MSFPLDTLPVLPDDLESMDPFTVLPQLMALMKNTLIRGMNNIHQIAGVINPLHPDLRHYLRYVECYCDILKMHFQGDNVFFTKPVCSGKPLMVIISPACNPSTELFQESLEHLHKLVRNYVENPSAYSGSAVRDCLTFGPKMIEQMKAQIEAIEIDELRRHVSTENIISMIQESIDWFAENTDVAFMAPFVLTHHDPATSRYWPPITPDGQSKLPAVLKVHEGVWQFAPFDAVTREQIV
ncbi:hypothetical protein NEOLEDRAFT_1069281 [Neolentinus lepideus HHB14362 ss-1]|uniref:Uncharacterized protein n=1 Tax=Neolentinus lepideus HHB14362 ss-1 TaxID=1314782 RepID=A0A165RC17_9AGAM|nr:hypothetical protein NEOLEDRAFT_1069281 [Neolentinus lepideus HHB14362 ss-1]